jgi:hypothetical protein
MKMTAWPQLTFSISWVWRHVDRIDSHVRTVEHVFAHEDLLSDTFLWFDRTDVMPSFIIIIFFHREDPDFRTGDDHSVVTTLQ